MIDLQKFCAGSDDFRPQLQHPISRGEYTYATNGHILVRVDRLDDAPEHEYADKVAKVVPDMSACNWRPIGQDKLPGPTHVECNACDGRGKEHDCPDCGCECDACNGTGQDEIWPSVNIGEIPVSVKYAALIQCLPEAETAPVKNGDMIAFRFQGGIGVLMRLLYPGKYHIKDVVL